VEVSGREIMRSLRSSSLYDSAVGDKRVVIVMAKYAEEEGLVVLGSADWSCSVRADATAPILARMGSLVDEANWE